MNEEKAEGKKDQAKGSLKKAYGEMTGNDSKKVEGEVDKQKGKAKEAYGDLKD